MDTHPARLLITGGAGYIGSHVVKQCLEHTNHHVTVVDNLSTGSKATLATLQKIRPFTFIHAELSDTDTIKDVLISQKIDTILHFAASIVVPESVENPLKYYLNNTVNTTHLIQLAIETKVKKFIFSSTAAVYGNPLDIPSTGITETDPTHPINPYGMSKLMSERVLQDAAIAHPGLKFVIFRYFNVAGADMHKENGQLAPRIGQSFPNATHLIKIASECAVGKRESMSVFGTDYPTPDGTGIRDYIHVDDLAKAHLLAVEYLDHHPSDVFNVGYGRGFSVREVIRAVERVSGVSLTVNEAPRRAGDGAVLISDNRKIKDKMGWVPAFEDLEGICGSVVGWEINLKCGSRI